MAGTWRDWSASVCSFSLKPELWGGCFQFGSWQQINTWNFKSHHGTFKVIPHLGLERQVVLLFGGCPSADPRGRQQLYRLLLPVNVAQVQKGSTPVIPQQLGNPRRPSARPLPSGGWSGPRQWWAVCGVMRGRLQRCRGEKSLKTTPRTLKIKNSSQAHDVLFSVYWRTLTWLERAEVFHG